MLVHKENHPRGFWKLAKVLDLIVSNDGQVRGATIKVG